MLEIRQKCHEQQYIENKLMQKLNYKILKLSESDVTQFEDGIITFEAAQLFLDYSIYKDQVQGGDRIDSFLPINLLKKFNKNSQRAKERFQNLLEEKQGLQQIENIILLHQDKYSKREYSLFIVSNIQNLISENNDRKSIIHIYKSRADCSDSEIDTLIDLRKFISSLYGVPVSNENLPSVVQVTHFNNGGLRTISESYKDQLRTDSPLGQVSVFNQIFKKPSQAAPSEESGICQVNFNQSFFNTVTQEMRDLLYFLYDYDYFSSFDVQNESSIIVNRRITMSQSKRQVNESSSSSSDSEIIDDIVDESQSYGDEAPDNQQNQCSNAQNEKREIEEEGGIDHLDDSFNRDMIVVEERTKRQSFDRNKDAHGRKLSTIVEEANESIGLSFDFKNPQYLLLKGLDKSGNYSQAEIQNVSNMSKSFLGSQVNGSILENSPKHQREEQQDSSSVQNQSEQQTLDIIQLQNCNQIDKSAISEKSLQLDKIYVENDSKVKLSNQAQVSTIAIQIPIRRKCSFINENEIIFEEQKLESDKIRNIYNKGNEISHNNQISSQLPSLYVQQAISQRAQGAFHFQKNFNQWHAPQLKHTFYFQIEVQVQTLQEGPSTQIKIMKNRSLSKKYLLGNQFQQKIHKLKKSQVYNTQSAPKLRELERSLLNMPKQMKQNAEPPQNLNKMILSVLSQESLEEVKEPHLAIDTQKQSSNSLSQSRSQSKDSKYFNYNHTFNLYPDSSAQQSQDKLPILNQNQVLHNQSQSKYYSKNGTSLISFQCSAQSKKINQSLLDLPEISYNESKVQIQIEEDGSSTNKNYFPNNFTTSGVSGNGFIGSGGGAGFLNQLISFKESMKINLTDDIQQDSQYLAGGSGSYHNKTESLGLESQRILGEHLKNFESQGLDKDSRSVQQQQNMLTFSPVSNQEESKMELSQAKQRQTSYVQQTPCGDFESYLDQELNEISDKKPPSRGCFAPIIEESSQAQSLLMVLSPSFEQPVQSQIQTPNIQSKNDDARQQTPLSENSSIINQHSERIQTPILSANQLEKEFVGSSRRVSNENNVARNRGSSQRSNQNTGKQGEIPSQDTQKRQLKLNRRPFSIKSQSEQKSIELSAQNSKHHLEILIPNEEKAYKPIVVEENFNPSFGPSSDDSLPQPRQMKFSQTPSNQQRQQPLIEIEMIQRDSIQQLIERQRKEKILQSVKNGKFTIKSKKNLQSGRMKYKHMNSIISESNIIDLKQSLLSANQKDAINLQQSVNDSNISCKNCFGTNWNQKYNMPCQNCVDTPLLSARKLGISSATIINQPSSNEASCQSNAFKRCFKRHQKAQGVPVSCPISGEGTIVSSNKSSIGQAEDFNMQQMLDNVQTINSTIAHDKRNTSDSMVGDESSHSENGKQQTHQAKSKHEEGKIIQINCESGKRMNQHFDMPRQMTKNLDFL